MKKITIFFAIFVSCSLVRAEQVIDLGTQGGTCDLSAAVVPHVPAELPEKAQAPAFTARLDHWAAGSYTTQRPEDLKSFVGKKVFVFGAKDPTSELAAAKVKADLGVCVQYETPDDLRIFREKTKISFPVQLGNDFVIKTFRVKSYPVLITVKDDQVVYSSDF